MHLNNGMSLQLRVPGSICGDKALLMTITELREVRLLHGHCALFRSVMCVVPNTAIRPVFYLFWCRFSKGIPFFYRISYVWYSMIACSLVVIVGIIVSLLTGEPTFLHFLHFQCCIFSPRWAIAFLTDVLITKFRYKYNPLPGLTLPRLNS